VAKEAVLKGARRAHLEDEGKEALSDAQIIRRQILIIASIVAILGALYGAWLWGEDTGWGNADRAVKMKLDKANAAFVNRDLDGAIAIYSRLVKKYPQHPMVSQALTQLATAYEEKGQLSDAASTYASLLTQLGDDKGDLKAYTMLQIGKLMRQQDNFAGALDQFAAVRSYKPGSDWAGEALSETGKAWQDQKDYPKAMAAYKQLIKEMPAGFLAAEAQSSIGECYEAQDKVKDAIKAYQVVLDKYPSAVWDQAKARIDILKKRLEAHKS
jgi:TolA-binding protein